MRKNIFILLIFSVMLSACGFEDDPISVGNASAYFYNQTYNRNIVVGEGLNLKAGIMFSGLINNDRQRVVNFVIDPTLIEGSGKTLMPSSYYTLSSTSSFVIPQNEEQGYIDIKIDSAAFVADPKALTGEYVLPFLLTGSNDLDSISVAKNFMILSVSYWAKQHGNYNYSGQTIRKSGATTEVLSYSNNSQVTESVKQLVTIGPKTMNVVADAVAGSKDPASGKFSFNVEVPSVGSGEVLISSVAGAAIQVTGNGSSTYDAATHTFYLKYKYTDGAYQCEATDTLVFRNRVRDMQDDGKGVNEWRIP